MDNSQVTYDYFFVDVSDPKLTHLWVLCRSDFMPAQGWRHKVISADVPFVDWLAKPENFRPLEWDRGTPPIRVMKSFPPTPED